MSDPTPPAAGWSTLIVQTVDPESQAAIVDAVTALDRDDLLAEPMTTAEWPFVLVHCESSEARRLVGGVIEDTDPSARVSHAADVPSHSRRLA